jgi:hypothetical protein
MHGICPTSQCDLLKKYLVEVCIIVNIDIFQILNIIREFNGIVALRFHTAQPGDATIRELFGLEPLNEDMDNERDSSDSDTNNSSDKDTDEVQTLIEHLVHLHVNDQIGNDEYLLRVCHILNARTHVVVVAVESEHADFVVGSEHILTIAQAQALYVAYNAM